MNRRVVMGLAVLCSGLTVALAYEGLAPAEIRSVPIKPVRQMPVDPPRAMIALPEQDFAVINERPVFSPARTPFADTMVTASAQGSASDLQLVGVIQGPEKSIALLKNTATLQTVNVSVGDYVAGWRIQAITPVHVILSSASGNVMLPLNDPSVGAQSGAVAAMSSQPGEAMPQPTAPTPSAPAIPAPPRPSAVATITTSPKAAPANAALPVPTAHGSIAPEALRSAPIDPSTGEPTL